MSTFEEFVDEQQQHHDEEYQPTSTTTPQVEEEEETFAPPPSASLFTQQNVVDPTTTTSATDNYYEQQQQQPAEDDNNNPTTEEQEQDNSQQQEFTQTINTQHYSQSKFPFIELSSFTTTSIEVIHDQLNVYSTPLFTIITTVNMNEEQEQQQTGTGGGSGGNHPLFQKTGLTVSRKMKDFEWLYDNLKLDCIGCLIPPKDLLTTNIDKLFISDTTNLESKILKGKYLSIFLSFCARHPILCKSFIFWDFISASEEEFNNTMKTQQSITSTTTNNSNDISQNGNNTPNLDINNILNFEKPKKNKNSQLYGRDKERDYTTLLLKNLKTMLQNSIQLKKYQELFLGEFDSIGRALKVYGNFEANNNFNEMMNATQNGNSQNGNTQNGNTTSSILHNTFHSVGDLTMKLSNVNSQQESTTQYEQYLLLYTKYLLPNLLKFLDLSKEYHQLLNSNENDLYKAIKQLNSINSKQNSQNNAIPQMEIVQKLYKQYQDMKLKVDTIDNRFPLELEQFRYELKIDLQYSLLGSLVKRANDNLESIQYLSKFGGETFMVEEYKSGRKNNLPTGSTSINNNNNHESSSTGTNGGGKKNK